jgi:hypothetical protein
MPWHHRVSRIEIGRELIAAKDECPHGRWLGWLKDEFGWTEWTARNYIKVASAFGESRIVANSKSGSLPDLENATITTEALYALASPRVPQIVRDEAVERATKGEKITKAEALLDWAEEPLARTGKPRSTRELRGELVAHTGA